ncbi:unnamed protein product [Phytophthora fragariaefolia]|uniref:Unnamed protein product n=1 Tax=Phytophthora fragariaefolia TaxID=1490495 RepID=A0A9W6WTS3_9STRA|nr:unnamed protein product [Phytophthora fragariaefolia]
MEHEDTPEPSATAEQQPAEPVVAPESATQEPNGMSKRQLKKLRRAERDPAERQAKKRKSKRDAKSANRFEAAAPKYSFANGSRNANFTEGYIGCGMLMWFSPIAGYRMVEPYVYEFRTFAKARWFGRELLEIFTKEFGANSPEYYNAAKAKALSSIIADRQASKTYLARVHGQFPDLLGSAIREKLVNEAKSNCSASDVSFPSEGGILISCPLRCFSARDGVWECHEEGKPSETLVRLVRTDKCTSLVECKPITGRTHQIRLHLQLIGSPIANDPCYGGELHFGESPERTKQIAAAKRSKADLPPKDPVDFSTPRKENESEEDFMKRTCTWCYVGEAEAFNETQLHCLKIWLHALEYKLDGQVYKVPEPSWAAPSTEY